MAFLTRVLALALLAPLASTSEECGWWSCPDFTEETDDSISYETLLSRADLTAKFNLGGPYTLIAAAESSAAERFTCIKVTPGLGTKVEYREITEAKESGLHWDTYNSVLRGTLPKDLLNTPSDKNEVIFTPVSFKEGLLVLKTCKRVLLHHYTSTYVLADKTVDLSTVDIDIVIQKMKDNFSATGNVKPFCP